MPDQVGQDGVRPGRDRAKEGAGTGAETGVGTGQGQGGDGGGADNPGILLSLQDIL